VAGLGPLLAATLAGGLESGSPPSDARDCAPSGAIVVLGGAVRPPLLGDETSRLNQGSDRVWTAARLYHAGCAPVVFVAAGGAVEPPMAGAEAPAIVALLVDLGVPPEAIQFEDRSRNTAENAARARAALSPQGVQEILLVSSAWHLRRARREFERVGFAVNPVGADTRSFNIDRGLKAWLPDAEALATTQLMWKEYLGFWWDSLKD
jgi:uncharacterized SAM-binding protein YcdF (DUF218 family)